jgi:hypothetical protein
MCVYLVKRGRRFWIKDMNILSCGSPYNGVFPRFSITMGTIRLQTCQRMIIFQMLNTGSIGWNPRPLVNYVEDVPSTYDRDDAMMITFTAGYTTIDYDVKQAILAWVYRMYENPNDPVTERLSFFDNVVADNRSYGL